MLSARVDGGIEGPRPLTETAISALQRHPQLLRLKPVVQAKAHAKHQDTLLKRRAAVDASVDLPKEPAQVVVVFRMWLHLLQTAWPPLQDRQLVTPRACGLQHLKMLFQLPRMHPQQL